MLIRFNVKNFKSFGTRPDGSSEEFSMIAGKVRHDKDRIYKENDFKLLKCAAVFGANASGKSNLVKAMKFLQSVVLYGNKINAAESYCKAEAENINRPSYFEIEMLIDGKSYAYGFEILLNRNEFVSEWLVETGSRGDRVIFTRDIAKGKKTIGARYSKGELGKRIDVYMSDISEDGTVLFLTVMNKNKKNLYDNYKDAEIFRKVFYWIEDSLDINYPNQKISSDNIFINERKFEDICDLLKEFGTGVTSFERVDVDYKKILEALEPAVKIQLMGTVDQLRQDVADEKYKKINLIIRNRNDLFTIDIEKDKIECRVLEFVHATDGIYYKLGEESDGTVRLLDLLEVLLTDKEDKTFVIDELDRCLHPSLTYKFVERFLAYAKKKKIQLIVTTHESRLLDFKLLRRDEIWFIDKRRKGESDIYSLDEFNERFDRKIDKAYLDGRYGGVPIFTEIFPIGKV